jgi:uncharacterized protein
MGNVRRTPQGGLSVDANLTRTGVFTYRMPDGTTRRELRHPDEVFNPDSLASFGHAPLTVGHPGRVTTDNYKEVNVGHVAGTPKRDGKFVAGTLNIQDAKTIADVESEHLLELSCGYECRMDMTPGEYEGEKFDAQQKDIRGNHVAMGPRGWGRAGPEVRLKMDGGVSGDEDENAPAYVHDMTDAEKAALAKAEAELKIATDALAKMTSERVDAKAVADKAVADATAASALELNKLRAENEVLKLHAKRDVEDTAAKQTAAQFEARVEETIVVRSDARKVFATLQDPTGSLWKHDGKDVATIKREVLKTLEPDLKSVDKLDGPALDSVYAISLAHWLKSDVARDTLRVIAEGARSDGRLVRADVDEDEDCDAAAARKKMDQAKRDGWKKTPSRMDRKRGRDASDNKGAR